MIYKKRQIIKLTLYALYPDIIKGV